MKEREREREGKYKRVGLPKRDAKFTGLGQVSPYFTAPNVGY